MQMQCKIKLENNENAVYFAGDSIKGTVEFVLHQPKTFRGLCLILHGEAQCKWHETHSNSMLKSTKKVPYQGKEVCFAMKVYIFGSENATPIEKPCGNYKYNFCCRLPSSLPASVKTKYGQIFYNLEAFFDIPWNFDKEFKLKFTVVRKENLNHQPELKLPFKVKESKTFYFFPFETDPLSMTVSLLSTGFVPGQKIHVIVNYINKSSVHVQQTMFMLRRIVRYHSYTPIYMKKFECQNIAEGFADGVRRTNSAIIEKEITVPSTATSNTKYSSIIQISYELKVIAEVYGFTRNMEVVVPIVIGSIPLTFDENNLMTARSGISTPVGSGTPVRSGTPVGSGTPVRSGTPVFPRPDHPDINRLFSPLIPAYSELFPNSLISPQSLPDLPPTYDEATLSTDLKTV